MTVAVGLAPVIHVRRALSFGVFGNTQYEQGQIGKA